jgi:hypothetical protein
MKKLSIFALSILLPSLVVADFNPYIGTDIQMRHMSFERNYGRNLFGRTSLGGSLYTGLNVFPNFGVEVGYDSMPTQSREKTLASGTIFSGSKKVTPDLSPIVFQTKEDIRGPYINLLGLYPISEVFPLEIIGSLGISFLRAHFERAVICAGNYNVDMNRIYKTHRNVIKIGTGLQYGLTDYIKVRTSIYFSQTNKLNACSIEGFCGVLTDEIKPNNSLLFGLGLIWGF